MYLLSKYEVRRKNEPRPKYRMHYLGGKSRIAAKIVSYLESIRDGRTFIEPFVGAINIISRMGSESPRYGYDISEPLITLYQSMQQGWIPPTSVSEAEYMALKTGDRDPTDPMTAFAGFGCAFGGTWFRGYARNACSRNYAKRAHNSLVKKMATCETVRFSHADYRNLPTLTDTLVYCDPPYAGTSSYQNGQFDNAEFWQIMRQWSSTNIVVISEWAAPDDFVPVWECRTHSTIMAKQGYRPERIERLYRYQDR